MTYWETYRLQEQSMSEISFAKSFLATLDKRAVKLSSDHVADPRKYPAQSPVSHAPHSAL